MTVVSLAVYYDKVGNVLRVNEYPGYVCDARNVLTHWPDDAVKMAWIHWHAADNLNKVECRSYQREMTGYELKEII